jgi:uncharacterized protein
MNMATTEQPAVKQAPVRRALPRISTFILIVQAILFLVHWFVYQTMAFFWPGINGGRLTALRVTTILLSVSFVFASLLAYRFWNAPVRGFYRAAAIWLGFLNFFFLAACASWLTYAGIALMRAHPERPEIAGVTFGLAFLAGVYGVLNAHWPRVKRISVALPNLPASWRGRVAAIVSDVHLGDVNGERFMRRIVSKLARLSPDVVFLPGDLFDGTTADLDTLVAPWKGYSPPFGTYFVTGNHEEFSDRTKYLNAVSRSGVRVLNNERVTIDGLQIVGVHDSDAAHHERFASLLESSGVDRRRASILLTHVPRALSIPEQAGISLQISGHTHGGQIFPFTWFTRRIFRQFTHGLNRFGAMSVYTSYGAGTWGPPMRVGTYPEIVLLEFK